MPEGSQAATSVCTLHYLMNQTGARGERDKILPPKNVACGSLQIKISPKVPQIKCIIFGRNVCWTLFSGFGILFPPSHLSMAGDAGHTLNIV